MSIFYHVTFKSRIDSIMSEGIKPVNVKHNYSDYVRKHPDSIYAFLTLEDALKWWDYQEKSKGYGDFEEYEQDDEQVIIRFEDNAFLYSEDIHYEMRKDFKSAVHKMPGEMVKPEQIQEVIAYNYIKDEILKGQETLTYKDWCDNYIRTNASENDLELFEQEYSI